jgi:ubiquinone/menaquinone biosynthesis C-methylase UbiE
MLAPRSRPLWLCGVALAVTIGALGPSCARRRADPNAPYRDPSVSAAEWNRLFEGPDRRVFSERAQIVRLAHLQPGMRVADVGAGTGLFSMLLSDAVGGAGVVYAEEVTEKFSTFIAARAAREGRSNVVSVVGTETGLGLPPASIDLAFLCDVYHHFDHPREMLASIRRALRPDGQLFLVDYRRELGRSPTWLLDHVRAGEVDVDGEIEAAGFTLVFRDESLSQSYALAFRRNAMP